MGPDGEMIEVVEGEYANENPKVHCRRNSKKIHRTYIIK